MKRLGPQMASWRGRLLAVALIISPVFAVLSPTPAGAESPSPTWKMLAENANDLYPPGYNAVVLFVDAPGCNGSTTPYYPPTSEGAAEHWIEQGLQVMIMIDVVSGCSTSLSAYESLASTLQGTIQGVVGPSAMARYFGGFMADEEPNLWSPGTAAAATFFTSYNLWLEGHTAEIPLSVIGDSPGYFTQAQYNQVAWADSWAAPQIYNQTTLNQQNALVDSYGGFNTLVTCNPGGGFSAPFNTCANAAAAVHGSPWTYSTWGTGSWYFQWQGV